MVLLKENIRRFLLFPILTTLVYILAVILPLYSARPNTNTAIHTILNVILPLHRIGQTTTHVAVHAIVNVLQMRQTVVLLGMVIVPFITVCLVFGFFYRTKESTLVQSFPFNRTQILLSSVLSGIILMVIPTLILSIGLILTPIRLEGTGPLQGAGSASLLLVAEGLGVDNLRETINSFSVVFGFFLRMMIAKIFYFALFWLAFSLTGQAIATILLAGVMPLIPLGVSMLFGNIARYYVFGFHAWGIGTLATLAFSNPALWSMFFIRSTPPLTWFYFWFSALALALMCIAFIISRLRKPERVGNPALFNPIKHVLVFLVSLTFMIFGGFLFYGLTHSHLMFYIGFVVGFVIGYIIAQMIAEKSLIIIHKAKSFPIYASVAVGMFLLMMFVTQVGMRFYTHHVPRQEDIFGVNFSFHFHSEWNPLINDSPEIIALTVAIHNEIIDNKALLLQPWRIRFGQHTLQYYFNINYLMKDGQIITRRYQLNSEFLEISSIPRLRTYLRAYLGVEHD